MAKHRTRIAYFVLIAIMAMLSFTACEEGESGELTLPDRAAIGSVKFIYSEEIRETTNEEDIDEIFDILDALAFKARESYNDTPMVQGYIDIEFGLSDGGQTPSLYVFKDEDGFFVEEPYNGVFPLTEMQYEKIYAIYLAAAEEVEKEQG